MGTTKGTELNRIWRETGAIDDDTEIIRNDKMYTSELDGKSISLWKDINSYGAFYAFHMIFNFIIKVIKLKI